jgi:adhesin/invasin
VAIAHDTLLRLIEGASQPLIARALDARGRLVRDRPMKWASGDTTIVTITETGLAQARGTGRTTLTAQSEGYSSSIAAEVVLTPAAVKLAAGQAQRAPAGRKLPEPVLVQVLSRAGRPVPDVSVTFTTDADEGSADPANALTDRNGRVRAAWTLGKHAGRQRLIITVAGVDSALTMSAEADPVAKDTRVQPARDVPNGAAGALLAQAVGVRVTDTAGAAESDVPVAWTVLDGGKIEAMSARTDSLGEAWAHWTLGPRAGTQRVRVQVGNPRTMPAFTMSATALANSATKLELASGGGQEGRVGAMLTRPVVMRLLDDSGNPVSGATVRVIALAGTVADSAPAADAQGRALIHWTLGSKAGSQELELSVGAHKPMRVSARALALEAANIALDGVPANGVAGHALPKPVTATVTDAYGNIVAGVQVAFSVLAGSVSPARVITDAKGQAVTHWKLGTKPGDQALVVSVKGKGVSTTATVTAKK